MVEPANTSSVGTYDIQKQYDLYRNALKGAKEGEVVTRFPPKPSGYLHIGHVKAAMLNYHYAKMWKGRMILRFDDTNPNKEKTEYVQSIIEDLAMLGITADAITHTSDNFDKLEELMTKAIQEGKAYCDDTPLEVMRKQRGEGVESKNRTKTPEENQKIWNDLRTKKAPNWWVRGKIEEGRMSLRFDDTNPNKEKTEYVQSIIEDLAMVGITADAITHTSDHFVKLEELITKAIQEGKAYCDDGVESKNRTKTPEENLKIWNDMRAKKARNWYVRWKIDMQAENKCMRDPVFYRCSDQPHHRWGTKYKVYPTYDWVCAIVDSAEGVTHTFRTNEYADRNEMYNWVLDCVGLRKPIIHDFSRLSLVNTTLSNRKLTWFVDTKRVESWDDPRLPTVRGVMRRGLIKETLTKLMLVQGFSNNTNLQEWDKLWAINKTYIDPKAGRYTAISKEKICTLKLTNRGTEIEITTVPIHPENPNLDTRPLFRYNEVYLEYDDAKDLKVDEKITLMKWSNCFIKAIKPDGDGLYLEGEIAEHDTDFQSTKKVNWLPKCDLLVKVTLLEFDHLINVKKVEDHMDFETILKPQTRFTTEAYADPNLKSLTKKSIIKLERRRRGYYIVDRVNKTSDFDRDLELIYVPDGSS